MLELNGERLPRLGRVRSRAPSGRGAVGRHDRLRRGRTVDGQYVAGTSNASGNFVSQGATVTAAARGIVESNETVVRARSQRRRARPANRHRRARRAARSTLNTGWLISYFFNWGSSICRPGALTTAATPGSASSAVGAVAARGSGMYRLAWKNGSARPVHRLEHRRRRQLRVAGGDRRQRQHVVRCRRTRRSYGTTSTATAWSARTVTAIEIDGDERARRGSPISYFINYGSAPVQVHVWRQLRGSNNQFPNWTAVGAERTIGGNLVAWRNSSTGQYSDLEYRRQRQLLWNSAEHLGTAARCSPPSRRSCSSRI